jgi:hypothetical protein
MIRMYKLSNGLIHSRTILLVLVLAMLLTGIAGCQNTPTITTGLTSLTTASGTTSATTSESTIPSSTSVMTSATTQATTESTEPTKPVRPAATTLTLELEGQKEKVSAVLLQSTLGYSMYYENSRYKVTRTTSQVDSSTKADRLLPISPAKGMPEIYLEIGHLEKTSKTAALATIRGKLSSQYSKIVQQDNIGVGVDKLEALVLHGTNGSKWDSKVVTAAVFSDGQSGVYYFMNVYYLEAAEGTPSRFNQLLDTLRVE